MAASYPIVETVLSTPTVQQINIYNRQEWPQPFLRELLFSREHVFSGPSVQTNYQRFRRALAPYVHLYQYGRIPQDGPRGVQSIILPAFGPTRVIRADDALAPPTGCYVAPRGTDYITSVMTWNWREMEQSLATREEWEIAQLLTPGTIVIVGDNPGDPAGTLTLSYEIDPPIALYWSRRLGRLHAARPGGMAHGPSPQACRQMWRAAGHAHSGFKRHARVYGQPGRDARTHIASQHLGHKPGIWRPRRCLYWPIRRAGLLRVQRHLCGEHFRRGRQIY